MKTLKYMAWWEHAPGCNRLNEWWRERRSWELVQDGLTDVRTLQALVDGRARISPLTPMDQEMLEAARHELAATEKILTFKDHHRAPLGSHVTAAQVHISAARIHWLRSFASIPHEVIPYLAGMKSLVSKHLPESDLCRQAAETVTSTSLSNAETGAQELFKLLTAVESAYGAALRESLRAGSFARIVLRVALFLLVLAAGVVVLTMNWPDAVPLCFNPPPSDEGSKVSYAIVCPAGSNDHPTGKEIDSDFAEVSSRGDYLVVEVAGLVSAGVASASALRHIRGTATPYQIPVALAALKLPAGALTAVLGLLLMRGGFVPGLSALDTSAQIIAWAIVFGYAQELFTKFVDKQGQMVLDSVHGPTSPPLVDGAPTVNQPNPPA
ncbi:MULTISPECIES: hypothetical protein [unclassified Streptomyces]|uniref:hypothetical protein n=1 Tax=unclassified Streptomyces TaxID=2593676 RepID=UPI0022543B18|nr:MULTISPECIES: hypothetical protein [unclassified Streptomyces]MCX5049923.1 hypothetical protein [Streptomyces sp. NBC_00474]